MSEDDPRRRKGSLTVVRQTYRVLVTGSRSWKCRALADRVVARLAEKHEGLVIVHGAAPGVDSSFAEAATSLGVATESHRADWDRFGRAAGPMRNQAMVDAGASLCLAFHPDLAASKGTGDCVRRALEAGIPTWWTGHEDVPPIRQFLPSSQGARA